MAYPYEYFLRFWGEIENDNLVEKELGISEKNFWFSNKIARANFKKKLLDFAIKHGLIIAFAEYEGKTVRFKTIANIKYEYEEKEYNITYDFNYGYPEESALYMFEEGNFSCDCNVSTFIHEKYPEFLEQDHCGQDILLKEITITLEV